jgi:hypothetical protein
MSAETSFSTEAIVSCGALSLEPHYLREPGFLDAREMLYTTPGLHQDCKELEREWTQRLTRTKEHVDTVIALNTEKFCSVNINDPTCTIRTIIH